MARRLGEILLERGLIDRATLLTALAIQQATSERLGSILLRLDAVTAPLLASVLGEQHDVRPADLERPPDPAALALLPAPEAYRHAALPLTIEDQRLVVAMADPSDEGRRAAIERTAGMPVEPRIAPVSEIYRAIRRWYGPDEPGVDVGRLRQLLAEIRARLHELEQLLGP